MAGICDSGRVRMSRHRVLSTYNGRDASFCSGVLFINERGASASFWIFKCPDSVKFPRVIVRENNKYLANSKSIFVKCCGRSGATLWELSP